MVCSSYGRSSKDLPCTLLEIIPSKFNGLDHSDTTVPVYSEATRLILFQHTAPLHDSACCLDSLPDDAKFNLPRGLPGPRLPYE
jgi:hypothetical protein